MYDAHITSCRALSNTAPVYLEVMQKIVLSVDEIDSSSDIESFVSRHSDLLQQPPVPPLQKSLVSTSMEQVCGAVLQQEVCFFKEISLSRMNACLLARITLTMERPHPLWTLPQECLM